MVEQCYEWGGCLRSIRQVWKAVYRGVRLYVESLEGRLTYMLSVKIGFDIDSVSELDDTQ